MEQKQTNNHKLFNLIMTVVFLVLAAGIVGLVYISGQYPLGSDTMCHVYKGEKLYQDICGGNWYPLLDMRWYNGVEILRYWAPLPVYLMAGCIALTAGNLFHGYLLFVGLVFCAGAVVWLIIGNRLGRPGMGAFLGILWFFMPNNLFALFWEGNLPRSLCMVFLPWLFYQMYAYCVKKRRTHLIQLIVTFLLISLCHLGYAGMILLAVVVFLICYRFCGGKLRKGFHCLLAMVMGMLLTGIWSYASLQGGMTATDSSEIMKAFFQSLWVSVNPLLRIPENGAGTFYFGLAALILAVVGSIGGRNGSKPYFPAAIVLLLLTSSGAYPILSRLPFGQYLWMLRFISIALCMIFMGLLLWKSMKRKILVLCCALLIADVLPSLALIGGDLTGKTVEERMTKLAEDTMIAKAKEITTQRVALMDQGIMEATGAYLLSDYEGVVNTTFGAGWQSASTADNIVMLNEALDRGGYLYLFDRCVEMGTDTVLVPVRNLQYGSMDIEDLDKAAKQVGYELVEGRVDYRLYHLDTPKCFGVISEYPGIAIGTSAKSLVIDYPGMEIGKSPNLNDYSYGELKDYEIIYLDGFTYYDKDKAENLIIELSEHGVSIVISAAGVPIDEYLGVQSFLDVLCQSINFSNGYPIMDTIDGEIDADLFPPGHTDWKTVYLEGLDHCYGSIHELDHELQVMGTTKNENIFFIGLGLAYHYELTGDPAVGKLLSRVMTLEADRLPKRTLVPLDIQVEKDHIIIRSEESNVNTTLAYHDIFHSRDVIWSRNQLLYVNEGTTLIQLKYPYFWEGLLVTVIGIVGSILLLVWTENYWKKRRISKVEILEVARPVAETLPDYHALVPDGSRYTIEKMVWFDGEDQLLEDETLLMPGKYCMEITVRSAEDEEFARDPVATVNGLKPDECSKLDDGKLLIVVYYTVAELFKFVSEPADSQGECGKELSISWSVSMNAKVGYLQVQERGGWIIVDTVACEGGKELTYTLKNEMVGDTIYRLVYVLSDGQTVFSREFTVKWLGMV